MGFLFENCEEAAHVGSAGCSAAQLGDMTIQACLQLTSASRSLASCSTAVDVSLSDGPITADSKERPQPNRVCRPSVTKVFNPFVSYNSGLLSLQSAGAQAFVVLAILFELGSGLMLYADEPSRLITQSSWLCPHGTRRSQCTISRQGLLRE